MRKNSLLADKKLGVLKAHAIMRLQFLSSADNIFNEFYNEPLPVIKKNQLNMKQYAPAGWNLWKAVH